MKVLLAVDGSKYSLAAVLECCNIVAERDDLEIKIVSVADVAKPVETMPFGVGGDFSLSINSELNKMAEKSVAEAKETVVGKLADKAVIETKILKGSPKIEIIEEAENWQADLIVVGSHGYGFFERMFIGSVSNAILHHAPCSVLVVKTKETKDSEQ